MQELRSRPKRDLGHGAGDWTGRRSVQGGCRTLKSYDPAMDIDLSDLAQRVSASVASYVVPERDPLAVGSELPASWFSDGLGTMRSALVEPFWTQMRDLDPATGELIVLPVVVVADDDGSLVVFDPRTSDEFALAARDIDSDRTRGVDVVACGVRGDPVDCFLSR